MSNETKDPKVIATMNKPMPFYRVHLVRMDGQPIDTKSGTISFSHGYYKSTLRDPMPAKLSERKVYSEKYLTRRYNKREAFRGLTVSHIETLYFDQDPN